MTIPVIEPIFDRMRAARNRVVEHTPGPNPRIGMSDWRADMDSIRECSVDGCERGDIQARDMCRMHYFRWYRTGSTTVRRPQRAKRGVCVIEGCEKPDSGPHGLCVMHRTRELRHGDPHVVRDPRRYSGERNARWSGDDATYNAIHRRLSVARGAAKNYSCVDCGGHASQWSYGRDDPDQRESVYGPYSLRMEHYSPRCVPCHKRFDLAARDIVAEHIDRGLLSHA